MTVSTSTSKKRRLDPDEIESEEEYGAKDSPWARRPRREEVEDQAETGDEEADEPETVVPVARGRKEIRNSRQSQDSSSLYFRWPEEDGEQVVVKFLDVDPWSYYQHWVQERSTGRKSFPCIAAGCPLCEVGIPARQKIVYTFLNLSHKEGPVVQTWEVAPTLDDVLENHNSDRKTGPLHRMYWAISRSKAARSSSFTRYNYSFTPIKERDLEEDWDIDPRTVEKLLETAEAPEPDTVLGKVTRKQLQEVADEIMER